MKTKTTAPLFSFSFDVAAGGMERLRNQDEILEPLTIGADMTGEDILRDIAENTNGAEQAFFAIEAARPDMSTDAINAACDECNAALIEAARAMLLSVTRGDLNKVNPFDLDADSGADECEEGVSLFIYIASPLFRIGGK